MSNTPLREMRSGSYLHANNFDAKFMDRAFSPQKQLWWLALVAAC
jgi:hypothetical protein